MTADRRVDSLRGDEKALELGCGDDCATVNIRKPLNCTLQCELRLNRLVIKKLVHISDFNIHILRHFKIVRKRNIQ